MKKIIVILWAIIAIAACKQPETKLPAEEVQAETPEQEITLDQDLSDPDIESAEKALQSLKKEQLITAPDDRRQLQELLIPKSYFQETDEYQLDFKYPNLNESIDAGYASFNRHILTNYIDIQGTQAQILEDIELFCDTVRADRLQEKRKIDYKVYNTTENLLSVLFYKENYYSGAMHSTYMFDCFNYDLKNYEFMDFSDFFEAGSEPELVSILNKRIEDGISSGECWELTAEVFDQYKSNFVFGNKEVEFYFDDCVICPSYTGTFSVKVPVDQLLPYMKKFNTDPSVGP